MQQIAQNGLTLRWGEPVVDAIRRCQRVVMEAGPASPANVMRVLYSDGFGHERAVRAWDTGVDPESGLQRFAADLPIPKPGSPLRWRPLLTNGSREVAPPLEPVGAAEADAPVNNPAQPAGEQIINPKAPASAFPFTLEYLARVTAPLDQNPHVVGDTPDGLRIIYPLGKHGTVEGPRMKGRIEHLGGDWMRIRDDGIGIAGVSVLITMSDGALVMGEYSGVVDFGRDGKQRLLAGNPPPQAEANLTPRLLTAAPEWTWLNRLQLVGFGRVTFSDLLVQYDIYAMHSEAVSNKSGNTDA